MTEDEWQKSADPTPMQEFLRGKVSERKLRLFAVACCRRVWPLVLGEKTSLRIVAAEEALGVAERLADEHMEDFYLNELRHRVWGEAFGHIDGYQRDREANLVSAMGFAIQNALQSGRKTAAHPESVDDNDESIVFLKSISCCQQVIRHLSRSASDDHEEYPYRPEYLLAGREEQARQCVLLCDIFGNPFRPVTLDPSWLSTTVTTLARQMYDARDFAAMPILAAALQDAGCDHPDVLAHCRGDRPHVRGCWVADLLLGKE